MFLNIIVNYLDINKLLCPEQIIRCRQIAYVTRLDFATAQQVEPFKNPAEFLAKTTGKRLDVTGLRRPEQIILKMKFLKLSVHSSQRRT